MRKLLRDAGLGPAGERAGLTWREFLRSQAQSMIACDLFSADLQSSPARAHGRIEALGSSRHSLARSCGLPVQSGQVDSPDGIDSEA